MKIVSPKAIRREILTGVAIPLTLALFSGWIICVTLMRPQTTRAILVALLLLGTAAAVLCYTVRRVTLALRWYGKALDAIPFPVVFFDARMRSCYENKAASDSIDHSLYRENALFHEIPEGYELTNRVACRIGHGGTEYLVSIRPAITQKRDNGYIAIFANINILKETVTPKENLSAEFNGLIQLLNTILSDFTVSTSSLAQYVSCQAESLNAVASVINSVFCGEAIEYEELEKLQSALNVIYRNMQQGGAYVEEITQVAGNIKDARQMLTGIMQQIGDLG